MERMINFFLRTKLIKNKEEYSNIFKQKKMSCNSCSNITLPGVVGPAGTAGANGSDGSDGNDGVFGGYSVQWQFETDILAPPSSGYLKLNNATPASVTELFVHDTAKDSIDASSFLASFTANNNPGSYGLIRIFKRNSSEQKT